MRTGVIVGHGDVDDVFSRPRHPYTASLLEPPGPTSVSVGALIAMTNPARAMIALLIALTAHKRGGREVGDDASENRVDHRRRRDGDGVGGDPRSPSSPPTACRGAARR